MVTKKAWKEVIEAKGADVLLGIKANTLYYLRSRAEKGIYPSETAMEHHLVLAGWKVEREREWSK